MESKVLNLDKSSWVLTKLGDLAKDISKRVDNPGESVYDRFVGLGNFVSGDIKIKTWETTENLASSAKAFQAGDILFARRNAYLRRASLVDFDGCCSGDAFVLREDHDKLVPGFLAFLMNSNALWDYAISNAAGTMSKRVKWRDLAEYEFLLPPKDQQAQLAKLLWAMDKVIEKEVEVLNKTKTIQQVKTKEFFSGTFLNLPMKVTKIGKIPEEWKLEKLPEISWFQEGPGLRNWQFQGSGIKIINITNLKEGHLDLNKTERHLSWGEFNETYKHFECKAGDIVVASSGNSYCKHAIIREQDLPLMMNTSVIRFQPINGTNYEYLNQFLKSPLFKFQIDRLITGAAQPNFGPFHLKKILVPIPNNYKIQENIGKTLKSVDKKIIEIKLKLEVSRSLQKSLINHIF